MKRALFWFRRDLRLHDNIGLFEACHRAEHVVPVFVLEDAFRTGPDVGAIRLRFLLESLAELRDALRELGSNLVVRSGPSEAVIPRLAAELKTEAVFCNIRYEPYAQTRDARVFNALNEMGVGFESFKDAVIWHEHDLLTKAGKPYTVFTPYAKAWKSRKIPPPCPAPDIRKLRQPETIRSETLPTDPAALGHPCRQNIFPAGEQRGRHVLADFLGKLSGYDEARDRVDQDGTSKLSPHLRAGTVGVRTILAQLSEVEAGARQHHGPALQQSAGTFLNELIWREFYLQVLHHFPHVMRGAFRPEYNRIAWSNNESHFAAWCTGNTGYPIIDAAMRCMNETGWMHNRLRMIVAMFFTKDLLLNWQWGERYFMQQLVDGDLAANNGGWQWSAGTGTDAAPYFRIFNPTTQALRCDPNGAFARRWLPELSALPGKTIHEPWKKTALAGSYPPRIVVHETQRSLALEMFDRARRA